MQITSKNHRCASWNPILVAIYVAKCWLRISPRRDDLPSGYHQLINLEPAAYRPKTITVFHLPGMVGPRQSPSQIHSQTYQAGFLDDS